MDNYLNGYGKEKCNHCGKNRTKEGHDGCIGTLPSPDIMNACCGHGEVVMAYVQFYSKKRIAGKEALKYIADNKELI